MHVRVFSKEHSKIDQIVLLRIKIDKTFLGGNGIMLEYLWCASKEVSVAKNSSHQLRCPEFNHKNPHAWRRQLTCARCSLTTHATCYMPHPQMYKIKKKEYILFWCLFPFSSRQYADSLAPILWEILPQKQKVKDERKINLWLMR